YHIDVGRGVVRIRCSGSIAFSEVRELFQRVGQTPQLSGHVSALVDLSETTSLPQTSQLKDLVEMIRSIQEQVDFDVCAIIATRDALFGMSRMFAVFAEPYFHNIAVFRDAVEAEGWLNVQLDHLARTRQRRA